MITLLIGGARSGKSRLAVRLAEAAGAPVVVVATGEGRDAEMAERIRRHRSERPADWETHEEPIDLPGVLESAPEGSVVLIDCLTLWVSNLMERGLSEGEIEDTGRRAAGVAANRNSPTLAVTNEVGSGIVPANADARRFGDILGAVNSIWADSAGRSLLVVAGRIVPLIEPDTIAVEESTWKTNSVRS